MSRVGELIDLIVQGKNAEASDVLNSELLARSYSAINDFKPEVAAGYFSQVVGEAEAEPEVSEAPPQPESDETN